MAKEFKRKINTGTTNYIILFDDDTGQAYNALTSAFETFVQANWVATKYPLPLTEVGTTAIAFADMPAAINTRKALRAYTFQQAGGSPDPTTDVNSGFLSGDRIDWTGSARFLPPANFGAMSIDGVTGRTNANAVTVVGGTSTSGVPVPVATDFTALAQNSFVQAMLATGVDSTGWTKFIFVIKRSDEDDDTESMVAVRITNPGSGSDGLLYLSGLPATSAALASITVGSITPDTNITVTLQPGAMAIPPSPDGTPYVWELSRVTATGKVPIGKGAFTVERGVLRSLTGL